MPPEAWVPARRFAQAVRGSVDRFLHIQAASGIILLVAAAVALVWANSPWGESYDHVWHTPISIGVGRFVFEESLHFWINDLLMTVFFLVVGLEIKRELVEGALSDVKRAALPVTAAIGGMLVPAAIYLLLNPEAPTRHGWGVPMATDIAFAVGLLTLLGRRVPATLRVLLLAVAIIDDIGAILVIAVFYSTGFAIDGLLLAAAGIALIFLMLKMGVRPSPLYAIPILIMWAGMVKTGIHPTIAGVIAGLTAPVRSWFGTEGFLNTARDVLDEIQAQVERGHDAKDLVEPLERLKLARQEALSPALRVEVALHPWVAWFIMPLFALANAGVSIGGIDVDGTGFWTVTAGVFFGLVVGKPLGIMAFSWLATKLGLCTLPDGVNWRGMFVLGSVAGIGFTMAIFITELAFADEALLGTAKLAVLIGTVVASTIGLVCGRIFFAQEQPPEIQDATPSDVEASTDYWTGSYPIPGPHP
jgi:NhaA family Na+:H+ antiporter